MWVLQGSQQEGDCHKRPSSPIWGHSVQKRASYRAEHVVSIMPQAPGSRQNHPLKVVASFTTPENIPGIS